MKAGEIKKPKTLPVVDKPPFDLPQNWRWTRIREITSERGQKIPQALFTYIDVTAIDKDAGIIADPKVLEAGEAPSRARKVTRKGNVIYSCVRPYLLNVAVIESDFHPEPIASTAFAILNGHGLVLPRYLWIVLRSPFMVECVERNQRGQAYPAINDADFAILPFPLPPLAEQHRIVAKVNELMALCDRLHAARAEREATRDRFTAASLARLNAPDPDTFPEGHPLRARRPAGAHGAPDQVKMLRQTILNLAVRGKLVRQDPNDEPASELLKQIAKEKARSNKAAADRDIAEPKESNGYDARFRLPTGWDWVCLDQITLARARTPSKSQLSYYEGGTIPWINSSATSDKVISEAQFFVTHQAVKECRLKIYPAGSLVVALYGQGKTRGQVAELRFDATVNQACAVVQWLPSFHDLKGFVKLTLDQQYEAMRERAEGGPQPNLNVGKIKDRFFPLPPLAEQRRIVTEVDELMALCDRLETSLVAVNETRRRLLEALLAEALAQNKERELEAAE